MNQTTSKHDKAWNCRFQQLIEYKARYGHCSVPLRYQRNPALGRWVNRQRENKNKQTLSYEREGLLNSLGFCWSQNSASPSAAWESRFLQLVQFQRHHGHCNVPQNYSNTPGLGGWVNRQRTARSKEALSEERVGRLDSIGFSWNMKNDAWDLRYEQLVKYKTATGNCDVPHGYDNAELSKWVQKQRYLYTLKRRGIKTNLSDERERKMNALSFQWNPSESSWNNQYRKLCLFKKLHGHCDVPRPYLEDPKLSNWVYNQRSEYSRKKRGLKSSLTDGRELKLNEIQFRWTILGRKFYDSDNSSSCDNTKNCTTTATETSTAVAASSSSTGNSPDRDGTTCTVKLFNTTFSPTSVIHHHHQYGNGGGNDSLLVSELLKLKG